VEYSYALNTGYPVAKVLNDAGYYVEPKASNVAVGLLQARINGDTSSSQYLTQILDGVYANRDNRSYPLSSYSYMVLPTAAEGTFNNAKGKTLGDFAYYFLCEGQQQAEVLGFSPLPINLVKAGLEQVRRIPGVEARSVDITKCNNPTFSATGENTIAKNAPQPPACDRKGATQCGTGTGGAKQATAVKPAARGTANAASSGVGRVAAGTGTGPLAAGSSGGVQAGSAAVGAGAAAPAVGQPVTAGAASGAAAVVDPDTGLVVAAPQVAGPLEPVVGVPVSLTDAATGGPAGLLMGLTALLLLLVALLPPLMSRRLRAADLRTGERR
jgi:hypothetical protein